MKNIIKICETFLSLQGESSYAGRLCFFIRLHGCNLNCSYCDTEYAKSPNPAKDATIESLVAQAVDSGAQIVEITGGEPMLQAGNVVKLCRELLKNFLTVLIETNGSLPLDTLPPEAVRVIDCKLPGSGEESNNLWNNFSNPREHDEFKFVISSKADYLYAKKIIEKYNLPNAIFSACWGRVSPETLAQWMIDDRSRATMQLQMHKYIWNPDKRAR